MAIQIMHTADVPQTPRDRVYKASRLHAGIVVLGILGICGFMVYNRWPTPRLSYWISGIIVLLLYVLRGLVTSRFHPSNWLVRLGDEGIFIHLRSYLNEKYLSPEDPTVAFVGFGDIRSARLVRECVETRDAQNRTQRQYVHWVEFDLAADPAPLADAIDAEYGRPGIEVKHWYGTSSSLFRDYPAMMQNRNIVRVHWNAVPRASSFLATISQRVAIAEPVKMSEDFTNLQNLPREQQDERLRRLARRGQTNAAVYMARRLHSSDLTSAVKYVRALSGGTQS